MKRAQLAGCLDALRPATYILQRQWVPVGGQLKLIPAGLQVVPFGSQREKLGFQASVSLLLWSVAYFY